MIHADLWSNNIMFKKDDKGQVQNAILFDFQLARYAPPAHDLVSFLHWVQNNDFRMEHQLELYKHYYETLRQELGKNDVQVEKVFPWETFLESCDYFDEYGAASSILSYQLTLIPSDIIGKFLSSAELFDMNMLVDRTEMITESYRTDEISRSRMTQAMNYFIKNYVSF